MILRIEIYEPLTEEQVEQIKKLLAEMGVTEITVEHVPETEEDCPECGDSIRPHQIGGAIVPMCRGCGYCPDTDEDEDELTEPQDDDWVTQDYKTWQMHGSGSGRMTVTDPDDWPAQMTEMMDREGYYPNLWYLGERGDWNLLDVSKGTFA
jgi:hypothetical protein